MNWRSVTRFCTLLVLLASPFFLQELQAEDLEKLRQEEAKLSARLDRQEAQYWNKRKAFIERKKNAEDEYKKLEGRYDRLIQERNSMQERQLKIESDNQKLEEELELLKDDLSMVNESFRSIIQELRSFIKGHIPYTRPEQLRKLSAIEDAIRSRPRQITANGRRLLDFIFTLLAESGAAELVAGQVVTADNNIERAWKLRLGHVFFAYLSSDYKKAGLLLPSENAEKAYHWQEELPGDVKEMLQENISRLVENRKNIPRELMALPLDVLQSRAVQRKYAREAGGVGSWLVELFQTGGPVMYPLAIIAILSLVIVGERLLFFRKNHTNADLLMEDVLGKLSGAKGDSAAAAGAVDGARGPLARMLEQLFRNIKSSREEAYNVLQEAVLHEIPVFERWLSTLKVFGVVAPLLGLLGTVSGMISLFDAITLYGTKDPKLLAGGISEALVTTQSGLIIAIPILLLHRFLTNRVNGFVQDMERYGMTLINRLWSGKQEGSAPAGNEKKAAAAGGGKTVKKSSARKTSRKKKDSS